MTRPDYCPVAQEPCQSMCALSDVRCKIRDTHTTKREWVGLTDEGIVWLMPEPTIQSANVQRWDRKAMHEFARAIEAKLKEKNT